MRIPLPRKDVILGAVLLGTVLVSGTAEARRPVVAPGQQTAPQPPPPPPASGAAAEPEAPAKKRPLGAPAPAPAAGAPATVPAAAPAADAAPQQPPAPLEFHDARDTHRPTAVERAEATHQELRSTKRVGEFVYTMAVRPGTPEAGEPVELLFRINEVLSIPDPAYGDRKPLTGGKIVATITGPDGKRSYTVHELEDAGTYGAHFTGGSKGVYKIELERSEGRRPQRAEFALGIGVKTPGLSDAAEMDRRRRTRGGVVEGVELVGIPGPSQAEIAGVMRELGRRWMELDRQADAAAAADAVAQVREQALLVAGKMPQVAGGSAAEFDRLAKALVQRVDGLGAHQGASLRGAMQKTQDELCMRCHAMYRFQFAESVDAWPNFTEKTNLQPAPAAAPRSGGRSRTPFRAQ